MNVERSRTGGRAWQGPAAAVLVLGALATAAALWWRGGAADGGAEPGPVRDVPGAWGPVAGPPETDPRLDPAVPYLNVRPDVRYVGDGACSSCHPLECDSYHRHPMGRSLAAVAGPRAGEHLGPDGQTSFQAGGLTYFARRQDGRLIHGLRGSGAAAGVVQEEPVGYVLGSGTRGSSYLLERDGQVFQSPISWYPQKGIWDLSPGYRERNEQFDRPVSPGCLFCHCSAAEPVENTVNSYRPPIFRGEAIGCERCHGPGERHVTAREEQPWADGPDRTIVNPARLEPGLREDVCRQCHLQGQARVLRRGRGAFDYRPGLPLALFWAVFVAPPGRGPDHKAVGQVEHMGQSRCFQGSGGQLGCTSCHDPHSLPAPEAKAAFYRGRCLTCHAERGCTLPAMKRQERQNDCAACHMPRLSTSDISHVAATDHRLLRDPSREPPPPRPGRGGPMLVPFTSNTPLQGSLPLGAVFQDRDLGIALADLAARIPPGPGRAAVAREAVGPLERATRLGPDDSAAWYALGWSLRADGRAEEALQALESALARAPRHEAALAEAAALAGQRGQAERALGWWRQAAALGPHRWRYHHEQALVLWDAGRLPEALAASETAIRLNPAGTDARLVRVGCLLDAGRRDEARAAFEELLALHPPRADELRRWFAEKVR